MPTVPVAVASIARIGQPDILCDEAAVVFSAEERKDFHCAQMVVPAHQRMERVMLSGPATNRQHAETLASGALSDSGTSEMTDDERAIRQVVDTWMAASKSGDLATVLSLMTDDVIFMVPGEEPFGKEAFAAAAKGMGSMQIAGSSEILELRVLGDWTFIRNRIEMKVTPPGANPIRRSGYALTLLRKEANGKWRLARDANLLTTQS